MNGSTRMQVEGFPSLPLGRLSSKYTFSRGQLICTSWPSYTDRPWARSQNIACLSTEKICMLKWLFYRKYAEMCLLQNCSIGEKTVNLRPVREEPLSPCLDTRSDRARPAPALAGVCIVHSFANQPLISASVIRVTNLTIC